MGKAGSARHDAWLLGLSFGMLIFFVVANLFVLVFAVPKFEQIFQDALPGKPLPSATTFIIGYHFLLAIFAAAWLIFCAVLSWFRNHHSILFINLGMIWFFLQGSAIVIALFMPMVDDIQGLAEPKTSPVPNQIS
jgi:hypothetical protein